MAIIEINWLSRAEEEIKNSEPICHEFARAITLRLSQLLLQRVGAPISQEFLALLPPGDRFLVASSEADCSLGLPDFISHAGFILGVENPDLPIEQHELSLQRIVQAYFRGLQKNLPESLKNKLEAALPSDIRKAA